MNDAGVNATAVATAKEDQSIFALLAAAHAFEGKVEEALERAGVSGAKYAVLSALVEAGKPLSLSELAALLSCVRSNMTQLVDRLEADGLVRRVDCPTDRRSVKAEITQEGRQRHAVAVEEVAQLHRRFADRVSPTDRGAIERLLNALT